VADEIKDLAERTSFSTQEIAALIHAVQQEVRDAAQAMDEGLKSVEEGFKVAKEAGDALKKIVESAKRSSEMAFSIERSTGEQSKATRLVSEAMDRVKNMVAQIAKATSEQSKGVHLIIEATEKMRSVAGHVKNATGEQLINTRQISEAIELVSDKSQQIARAISDQRSGSNQIWRSVEKIKDIPRQNRDLAFRVNHMLMELLKDSELTVSEMERFKLFDRAEDIIKFGIVPLESPAEMFKRFGPLAEYLGKKLGRKVELKVAVDFHVAMEDIGYGATHLCFMTPSTYIEAHNKYDIELLVKALRGGKPYHHSVIIVRGDSGINSVENIKGRTFAFGDLHSTSSHIVPRAMLLNAGIDLNDLLYYNYLGHHDNVVNAVLRGDFDAGGVMESVAYRFKDRGIKIIKFSDDIPEFNICVSRTLPEKDRTSIKAAFIALTDATSEGSTILKSIQKDYTGFMEASDEDYNSVRLLMSKLGMI
jgi:phosphate/phosphite/phosphonate ABC transporter binding protein